jgi:aspartate/methionine/tyrosine aminotransferase
MSSSSPSGVAEPAAAWPALRASGLWQLLSQRGRRAVLPEGIRAWVERARAADVDATIGVLAGTERELAAAAGAVGSVGDLAGDGAGSQGGDSATIFYLSLVREQFPELSPTEIFPYTPVAGTRAFREAWRAWLLEKSGRVADPERVRRLTTLPIATPGVSGALFACGHLLLDPGEALVVADKRWDGYDTSFTSVLGARLVSHRLFTPAGALDLEGFERRIREVASRQPKVTAVLNFPNNPTGFTPSPAEVEELRARVRAVAEETRKPLVLLFDDAYEGFVYDDAAYPVSPFYAFLGLHPLCRPIKCDGITKELLFWGGRLGALTLGLPERVGEGAKPAREGAETKEALEAEWENKCSAVLRAIVSSATTPVQALAARLLRERLGEALAERERLIALLRGRRERLRALLASPAAREVFQVDPFNGGLFAFLNLRAGSAQRVALRALREHRVGVVPMENPELGINALRLTFGSVPEAQLERLVGALVASAKAETGPV